MRTLYLLAAASSLFAQTVQPPQVSNARFATRPLSGSLNETLGAAEDATWFAYSIPSVRAGNDGCGCGRAQESPCFLEERQHQISGTRAKSSGPVQLEASKDSALLLRVERKQVDQIRIVPLACSLDAGGRPFVWLTGVSGESSLDYLTLQTRQTDSTQVSQAAVFAIAQHDLGRADDILETLAKGGGPVRESAIFWLGASRGSRGITILKDVLASETHESIRDKAVFALSVGIQPDGTDALLDLAKNDKSPHIRGQALFWLAQKAGAKATGMLERAANKDPDEAVKKQAVFATSQLPGGEGVPKLIEVARSQRDRELRREAFFWLGQSNDPRAAAFTEQVLLK